MSNIRPLEPADIPAIAGMFQRVFCKDQTEPPAALVDYMRQLYLDAPGCDREIRPLVHVNGDGRISGFVGVNALPMTFNGRPLRAAICGSLMAEDRESDPMAGARLLKAFLAGPQDLSFSETASEVSTQMWTKLRGIVLPQYSLDWVRVIRPSAFTLSVAEHRIKLARLVNPLAHAFDRFYRNRMGRGERRWSAVPESGTGQANFRVGEIDRSGFADLVGPLTAQFLCARIGRKGSSTTSSQTRCKNLIRVAQSSHPSPRAPEPSSAPLPITLAPAISAACCRSSPFPDRPAPSSIV